MLKIAARLGFASLDQIESAIDTHADGNVRVKDRLLADGVVDSQQFEIIQNLADELSPDATDDSIDERIAAAYATLSPNQESTSLSDTASFSTLRDPQLEQAAEIQDPYRTIGSDISDDLVQPERRGGMRFRVIRKHAEGGLGTVSLAQDIDFGRDVAIKEIKERFADIPHNQSRFIFEAEITGRLEHPGVVPVYALGRHDDGRPFYAMRFITGRSLAEAIKDLHADENRKEFSTRLRSLLNRFGSVCNTIEYAHSRGVVHRDLKPDNIMLGEYGENLVVDWGLAKPMDSDSSTAEGTASVSDDSSYQQTQVGSIIGTPYYMSPEQATGNIDLVGPQADVFSLGATLFHILTGSAPLRNITVDSIDELLELVRSGKYPSPKELRQQTPKALDAICAAATRREMKDRYPSARALADDIDRYLADDQVSVLPETAAERIGRWTRKHRGISMAIASAVLVVAAATTAASVITMRALADTELANTSLEHQLSLARMEQDFDRVIVAEEKRLDARDLPLADTEFGDEIVSQLTSQIVEIEQIRGLVSANEPFDQLRRQRLLNVWAGSIETLLTQPQFTLAIENRAVNEIDRLKEGYRWNESMDFVERLANLQLRLSDRKSDWRPSNFNGYSDADFTATGDIWQRNAVDFSDDWPILLGECPQGDVSLEVDFVRSMSMPAVGLILNAANGSSYEFVVADESYDPLYLPDESMSIADSNRREHLQMFIVRKDGRGESILRKQPIRIKGSLRLRARREGVTKLTFSVGGREVMEFDDPFPLNPSEPGQFGLICPSGAIVRLPKLEYHILSDDTDYAPGPIQRGDALMAADDVGGAQAEYSKLPNDIEAQFKLALTYQNSEADQAQKKLADIFNNFSPEGTLDQRAKRWFLNATVRLMEIYMHSESSRVRVGHMQDKLWANYSMREVQELVPAADKELFLQTMLKSGQRWRIAYINEGDAEALRRSIDLFSESPQLRRNAIWRWCDAVRCDAKLTPQEGRLKAIPEMRSLVAEVAAMPDRNMLEFTTLTSDLVWMLLLEKEHDEAMGLVQPWLEGRREDLPTDRLPLLIDRARIYHATGDLDAAKSDLEHVVKRIDPATRQDGIHYAHFSEAHGLLGILHADAGDEQTANELWLRGRRRNWHTAIPSPEEMIDAQGAMMVLEDIACDDILVSWTDGYGEDEWRPLIESILTGSGVDDDALLRIILHTEKVPAAWIKLVSESIYKGPRGRIAGREEMLRQSSMIGKMTYGAMMMLYQAVLQTAYDGDASLEQYPELDVELFEQTTRLVDKFQEGAFVQSEMTFILGAWSGNDWNTSTFEKLSARLNDTRLSAGLASVFAMQMIKHHGKIELGEKVLQDYVYPYRDEIPAFYIDAAQETLRKAKAVAAPAS